MAVRPEPFDSLFVLSLSKDERFAQDGLVEGWTADYDTVSEGRGRKVAGTFRLRLPCGSGLNDRRLKSAATEGAWRSEMSLAPPGRFVLGSERTSDLLKSALRRLLVLVPVLFLVTILISSLIYFSPGDPVRVMLGLRAQEEAVAAIRAELGFSPASTMVGPSGRELPMVLRFGV